MICNGYNTTKTTLACLFGGVKASWLAYSLSLLMLLLAYGQARAQSKSQQIKQGETPTGLQASAWTSIQKQMQMSKYKAYPQTDGSYASANLAHGLQIAYAKDGNTTLTPRDCDQADYHVAMRLQGIGYDKLAYLDRPAEVKQEDLGAMAGSKVTYQWNANLREWWINDKKGLEQWFSLQEAPQGRKPNTPLHLRMALQTDMHVTLQNNHLQLQKGNTTLHYDKLKVWDATGKEIATEMHYTQGFIDFYIQEANAAYPLTIDPTWTQQAYLKASNTGFNDKFGHSVAISGETVVIGAYGEASNATGVNGDQTNNSATDAGAVYIFVRSGTTWTQQAYLKASNTGAGDFFGYSVAISGETVVVGASQESSNAIGVNGNQVDNSTGNAGATYIFVRSGTTWTQQAYLKASNTDAGDKFGSSVAISGETVVVGAPYENSNATGVNGNQADNSATFSGAAYIFVRGGTTWTQQAYLKASNTSVEDNFGYSVAISGEIIVVGAWGEGSNATGVNGNQSDDSASSSGAAYIFVRSGTTWTQQAYLKASNTGANDNFGWSVAISGETLVVGAWGEDSNATGVNGDATNNSTPNAGAAYVFVRSGTTWTQQAYLKASNTGASDQFGCSVAISGETVVVGARAEASNATGVNGDGTNNSVGQAGAAYIFLRGGTTWTQQAYLKASNTKSDITFGWSVAIADETVVVGADRERSNATGVNGDQTNSSMNGAGAAYVFLVAPSPEINLKQNTTFIASAGSYDFGAFTVNQSSGNITFKIENTGNAVLNLTGNPKIAKNGTHANDFTITETLPATLNASGSATFTINFTPSGVGTRTAQISIANNDSDENPYIVNLTGVGQAPEINLKQNLASIASGGGYDFGAVTVNQSSGNITFTIENIGNAVLNLTGNPKIVKSGTHANDFTITETLPTSINASGSATFTINFTPSGVGTRTAQISIANNDSDENPYIVNLTGGGQAPEINLKQNLASIASGGSYDFGAFTVNQSSGNITFTIENTGSAVLNLTGNPKIVKSGTNASDFTITETLPATINASDSATFTINFTPSGVGTRTAQISIANNDSDENPYILNLTASGTPAIATAPCEGRGIYPNPARNMITISLEGNTATEIAVMLFDAQGKFCLQYTLPVEGCKAHFPLRNLSSGLYLLQFQVGNEWITEKVVVIR